MFKKIVCIFAAFLLTLCLTGCSTKPVPSSEPTKAPIAIHNVGETIQTDTVKFVISRSGRVNATVDKAHAVYGICVKIYNNSGVEIPFKVSNVSCYAGEDKCELYAGMEQALNDTIIAVNDSLEGWIYYKIPLQHSGLSFTYCYDGDNYISLIFSHG